MTETKSEILNKIDFTYQELTQTIDGNHKYCYEQVEYLQKVLANNDKDLKNEIAASTEKYNKKFEEKIEFIRNCITRIEDKNQADSEEMQEKYNVKLAKIKDVCAQYFSKYEKHLLHQAELVKALEARQENWVNKLIKPQEVNQARLFSVDTRIKEGELTRLKDLQFMRDTFKKLIYAIEQNSMAR